MCNSNNFQVNREKYDSSIESEESWPIVGQSNKLLSLSCNWQEKKKTIQP